LSKIALEGNASGTGTLTIASQNTNSNYTLTIPNTTGNIVTTGDSGTVSQTMLATGVSGSGPAFSAYASATTSVSNVTFTKVNFATENFDTNNNFASSRFTPTVAGYYQISFSVCLATSSSTFCSLYKNGSGFVDIPGVGISGVIDSTSSTSLVMYLNGTTDYVEVYCYQNTGSTINAQANSKGTWFTGALVRAA
jgi:hypothetical protein